MGAAAKDARVSLAISEAYVDDGCDGVDTQSPKCPKITISDKLRKLPAKSREGVRAEQALFKAHPGFAGFPKMNGTFSVYRLDILHLFLVNRFGPKRDLTVDDYLYLRKLPAKSREGVLPYVGVLPLGNISLAQQIQQVMDTFQQFIITMGEVAAKSLVSNSIFYILIGSNDYIHYYLLNESKVQSLYLPWSFNQFLGRVAILVLQNLYTANVRNVVVMGLAPLGCAPYYLWLYESENGECVEMINDMIVEFNYAMRYMVEKLNHELEGANIVFCDAFEGSMDIMKNSDRYGFNVTNDACCGLGHYQGWILCISSDMACSNASSHIWWDQCHPTGAVNEILADIIWSGLHVNMCYPMNLQEMKLRCRSNYEALCYIPEIEEF
ncbi:GDSL esterase/lipase At1g71250-like [Salvia hispanica]|uniref:GDSL esterase/lipase At1g71250-like n=1 Tax=Salvia hispanica TaxID=49212 RepID=UPI002008FC64|nr:GDSL esterase/lipase At1g71250-like [Salvia hispanica]